MRITKNKPTLGVTIIEPTKGWASLKLKEVWEFRDLLFLMAQQQILIRYKQTLVGAAWAIIQPLFSMIIFSFFLGNLAKIPSDGLPYPIFCFAALLPWQYFANTLMLIATCLVENSNLLTKVYFPRLVIPLSRTIPTFLDFCIAFIVLLGMMFFYEIIPGWNILFLPFFILLIPYAALAIGLWLAALNVKYRDITYAVPFLIQLWLFASPVAYSSSLIPEQWRFLFGLNPMTGVIEGFRWALLGTSKPPSLVVLVSVIVTSLLMIFGLFYFRKTERSFADII